ncbi:hypothetical protein BU24DRAFT_459463 [Aaosphaeria arxii CBS 175.79]|uniref:DUF788-domain-containing protein n=1 Tax=Aaosphaeria arxii CBS 175.79 TaxID=1450172 RepID=A0A6A5Y5L0_9PLEO|nr:uncharacterized protein BU24DRAFT_459463 [Aaosphaeria arxii CBS 175.79]KAF2019834.1 hypothetical protein BU24DRAFT_459463 [Aaosphaeria arxii CBS 175.79]
MAQKAQKTLAASNTSRLNQTLLLTLIAHFLFLLLRALVFRSSFTRRSLLLYLLFSSPQLLIQFYFERLSRPIYDAANGSLKRAGEDLDAKGLTEWMWDVVYWTYGCVVVAAVVGDYGWWLWAVVPAYSVWLAWSTYRGVRGGFTDAAGVPQPGAAASKRQAKLEKRGGQRVAYR